ncbi:MAG: thioredoxin family protein [Verrucomicrobia bacterium]|nr:thioredoxin family protein [Verrucomicrobiota bacterium]
MMRLVNRLRGWMLLAVCLAGPGLAAESPFAVTARFEDRGGQSFVRLSFSCPPGHHLYADSIHVQARPAVEMILTDPPRPSRILDKHSEEERDVFDRPHDRLYRLPGPMDALEIEVKFQGCDQAVCYFPETRVVTVAAAEAAPAPVTKPMADDAPRATADWRAATERFTVSGKAAGYLSRDAFLAFLEAAEAGGAVEDRTLARWEKLGWLATVLLILVGGVALNLTPCVLPLIPVNLAILGAGARAGSRWRGFALGGVYGLGMALAYGSLGLIVVLTGARFGSLNASPWFNAAIAVLFIVLALAMFDVIEIDLSRFQGGGGPVQKRGRYATALIMGVVAALLAGACVAPVLISVLLLAGSLYGRGVTLGLLLPFLLGLGMALPWPLAGAGLSFLPKPGRWMTVVRNIFGAIILLLALYYGFIAYRLFRPAAPAAVSGESVADNVRALDSAEGLAAALDEAADAGRPVFIDFWATWCKNCHAMEKTTFKDPDVVSRLARYLVVKVQTEQPGDAPASEILEHFGSIGLPTYIVLNPAAPAR